MTDRAKQAREVARLICDPKQRPVPKQPNIAELEAMLNDPNPQSIIILPDGSIAAGEPPDWMVTVIQQALVAEHNATVEACARIADNGTMLTGQFTTRAEIAAMIRALLVVEETVGEGSHERT